MTPSDLKKLRVKLGISQAKLAALIGTTSTTVYRWETGRSPISEPIAKLIAMLMSHTWGHRPVR